MISALMLVWNGIDYIDASIQDAVDNVDEIVIIEGRYQPGEGRRSTDGTLDVLRKWKDHSKVKVVINDDELIATQEECRNMFFEISRAQPKDYLLVLDFDEFYCPEDWKEMRMISEDGQGKSYEFNQRVFVNDYKHYTDMTMPRFIEIQAGCGFKGHGNNMHDKNGNRFPYIIHPTIKMFHYSYVTNHNYFNQKVNQRTVLEGREFPWELRDGKIVRDGREILVYEGKHPKIIEERYVSSSIDQ